MKQRILEGGFQNFTAVDVIRYNADHKQKGVHLLSLWTLKN